MAQIQISKWGNSAAIRLPKAVLDELGLKQGQTVELTVQDGKGIIEPARPKKITLAWIISEMDRLGPENAPGTVDWGPDRGDEIIDDEYSRGEVAVRRSALSADPEGALAGMRSGAVLVDQIRSVHRAQRGFRFIERAPVTILSEIRAILGELLQTNRF